MKTISFILFALSTILSMFPIISKAQDVDFDIYPAEALKSCGILFMEPRTSQNPFYAPQITMACEKDDYYEMTASQYRILKSDMDSLGMQYISLEDAIRICKANPYWAENKIGTPIKQPERMPNNPHVDSTDRKSVV